ncbi:MULTISPECIES: hypothetical protein [unclassified Kribbella]|uniref:hypothetical protein n=1 Tax=unclassified Kribbella TaxID=2644121 RepID=UPI0030176A0D
MKWSGPEHRTWHAGAVRETPRLLAMPAAGRLEMPELITHRFGLGEMQDAYDVFARAGGTGSLTVALFSTEGVEQDSR